MNDLSDINWNAMSDDRIARPAGRYAPRPLRQRTHQPVVGTTGTPGGQHESGGNALFHWKARNGSARNCDDHTKNFSFILKQGGRWQLAPAYDICHAYRPASEWVSHHALSINGKRDQITREDLVRVGHSIRYKKTAEIIDEIEEKVHRWGYYAEEAGVDKEKGETIGGTLVRV